MTTSKIEKEAKAIEDAEIALRQRKAKLLQLEKEEREKKLSRIVRKVGHDNALAVLERASEIGPKKAVEKLAAYS